MKSAQGRGLCRVHGGGQRCCVEDCRKWAQRQKLCTEHFLAYCVQAESSLTTEEKKVADEIENDALAYAALAAGVTGVAPLNNTNGSKKGKGKGKKKQPPRNLAVSTPMAIV